MTRVSLRAEHPILFLYNATSVFFRWGSSNKNYERNVYIFYDLAADEVARIQTCIQEVLGWNLVLETVYSD
jgi:hypothetical protein